MSLLHSSTAKKSLHTLRKTITRLYLSSNKKVDIAQTNGEKLGNMDKD